MMQLARLRPLAVSFAVAAAGGALAHLLGLPSAWLAGAMLATAALALSGHHCQLPRPVLMVVYLALGVSMGSAVTPETLAGMARWPVSMAGLPVAAVLIIVVAGWYLEKLHGLDRRTAVFAAIPGALSYVMAMAIEQKLDVRTVAVVQTLRLIVLIAVLPLMLAGFGGIGMAPAMASKVAPSLPEMLLLAGTSLAGGLLFHRLRWPGGILVGAMITSGIVHGAGLVHGRLPDPLLAVAFITLGMVTGGRFAGTDLKVLRRLLLAGLGVTFLALVISLACALLVAQISGLPRAEVILAYAPGALEAMTVLAFSLHVDPAFVGAHHLVRFIMIAVFLPVMASWLGGVGNSPD